MPIFLKNSFIWSHLSARFEAFLISSLSSFSVTLWNVRFGKKSVCMPDFHMKGAHDDIESVEVTYEGFDFS